MITREKQENIISFIDNINNRQIEQYFETLNLFPFNRIKIPIDYNGKNFKDKLFILIANIQPHKLPFIDEYDEVSLEFINLICDNKKTIIISLPIVECDYGNSNCEIVKIGGFKSYKTDEEKNNFKKILVDDTLGKIIYQVFFDNGDVYIRFETINY